MTPEDRRGRALFVRCVGVMAAVLLLPPLVAVVAGVCIRLFRWAAWGG